jgi:hypothetical protein
MLLPMIATDARGDCHIMGICLAVKLSRKNYGRTKAKIWPAPAGQAAQRGSNRGLFRTCLSGSP